MFSKTFLFLLIVNSVSDSYGQRAKKFFRKDYHYIEALESFYKIHATPMAWADAKQVCQLEAAIFFYPENEDEASTVLAFWNLTKRTVQEIWIGVSDLLVEGVFETVDGNSISEIYTNWLYGEPNDSGIGIENCARLDLTSKMNDYILCGIGTRHRIVHIDTLHVGKAMSEVYYNWQSGQPDNYNSNQDCTCLVRAGDMDDNFCDSKKHFICKKRLKTLEWNHNCDMPNLDYTFSKDIGKCYKLHTTPLKWSEAYAMCQLEQSNLAVISNRREADYLVQLTESTPKPRVKGKYQRGIYHLGFHNKLKDGWQTVKGTPLNVDADAWFDNYQPDGDEECGSMFYDGRLINTDCEMKSFFICEHELDNNIILPASAILSNSEQPFLPPYVGGGAE